MKFYTEKRLHVYCGEFLVWDVLYESPVNMDAIARSVFEAGQFDALDWESLLPYMTFQVVYE